MVSGQLHPGKMASGIFPPPPPENFPLDDCPQIIASLPLPRQLPRGKLPPRLLIPDNYPKDNDNCPLTIFPRKLFLRETVFRMICRLHNCPSDKQSRGKLPPMEIFPKINYTRDVFSLRIRNLSTFIDSFFLFFSFCVV